MFQDLLTYLKLETLPVSGRPWVLFPANYSKSTVAVVDECYPSECIKFRSILNPRQMRFRVNGSPSPGAEGKSPAEGEQADPLPLKPSKKQRQRTPSPTHPSEDLPDSPAVTIEQAHLSTDAGRGLDEDTSGAGERDALDDIIDQTKAARDLVSIWNYNAGPLLIL